MVLSQKLILLFTLFCFAISCNDKAVEQQTTSPKKSTIPSSERKENVLPFEKPKVIEPTDKERKKKKSKQRDTLKPIVVIP